MRIDVQGVIVPNDDAWIYDWFDMDHTAPRDVGKAIEQAKAANEQLDVYINSGGGDVFSGSEIYAALRAYNGAVRIHVTGIAASAASVIAMAGESDIAPTAQIMVHNVSTTTSGDYRDMEKSSEILQQANRAMAAAYVDKTGMPETDALDMMDAETWLTAAEAVAYGLIDEIAENQNDTARMVASVGDMLPTSVIAKMKHEQQELLEYFGTED